MIVKNVSLVVPEGPWRHQHSPINEHMIGQCRGGSLRDNHGILLRDGGISKQEIRQNLSQLIVEQFIAVVAVARGCRLIQFVVFLRRGLAWLYSGSSLWSTCQLFTREGACEWIAILMVHCGRSYRAPLHEFSVIIWAGALNMNNMPVVFGLHASKAYGAAGGVGGTVGSCAFMVGHACWMCMWIVGCCVWCSRCS